MPKLEIELEDVGGDARLIEVAYDPGEPLATLVERLDEHGDLDADGPAVAELALGTSAILDERKVLGEIAWLSAPIRLRRVCVEVHFETEVKRRNFPVRAHWARVHRYGCRSFHVAHDACAHLELREGSSGGPPINERQEIGPGPAGECKVVWLVKPGPEPNGR